MLRILDGQEPEVSYPFRIWLRWALIPVLLVTIWQAIALVRRWWRAGWPVEGPTKPTQWFRLVFQLLLPVGVWYVVLRWAQVSMQQALRLDPDIIWSFLLLTVIGMVTGLIKKYGGEAVRKRRAAN